MFYFYIIILRIDYRDRIIIIFYINLRYLRLKTIHLIYEIFIKICFKIYAKIKFLSKKCVCIYESLLKQINQILILGLFKISNQKKVYNNLF